MKNWPTRRLPDRSGAAKNQDQVCTGTGLIKTKSASAPPGELLVALSTPPPPSATAVRALPDRAADNIRSTNRDTQRAQTLTAREPVHVVSARLGHASAVVTMTVYAHVLPGSQRDAADRFAALVGGAQA